MYFKIEDKFPKNHSIVTWHTTADWNFCATQEASICAEDMRSDKRKGTETDLYQNFRGKTTIGERITGVAYEIADGDQSATE